MPVDRIDPYGSTIKAIRDILDDVFDADREAPLLMSDTERENLVTIEETMRRLDNR